ncbi:3-isopropylmalate dehydrogenase [Elusimicrobium posterum]|uniref:3-isopropylmalate dehydrogenase n=1 Tax=Elusimicrobium posterum TaxID=3116653 RepID=UPI003C73E311
MKKILVLEGDGIGKEVIAQALKVLETAAKKYNFEYELDYGNIGGAGYDAEGSPLPQTTIDKALKADAVLLGAVGGPKWDGGKVPFDKRPEAGILGIRKVMGLFANLRPAMVFDSLADASTLKKDIVSGLDIMIVRELTGGLYFGEPRGRKKDENGKEYAFNTLFYTREEIERIVRLAFELAQNRSKHLTSIDKANVLESMVFWREIAEEIAKDFKDVKLDHMYVDNAAMQLVRTPKQFDVMVTENMFGDILSDCAAQLTGSLGMLPSASLGPVKADGGRQALYEPSHGSAPDIAGKDMANPIATILSLAMMLKISFGLDDASKDIENAVNKILEEGYRTADIMQEGKTLVGTAQMGDLLSKAI